MKTRFIIPAMFILGLGTAPLMGYATISTESPSEIKFFQEKEKVKVDPANLPVPVKEAILKDETLKPLKISEAWQVITEDEIDHFVIKFEDGGEELIKKYTALGEEIEG
ncbi:hypothetical protein M3O96_04530 [Aquiflexum sp. TKW24L]|uniref:hypothetical protein n=1 Tax=Aquiflexum sp. TKW24L TaxID=2942212 RepID=UPI0020C0F7E0|nr:hypothetical protein [Aquiflexum sp. TKW24L]MCL6258340.1 hypothetical protein [Aquiflexum sp. TKW24L]